MEKKYLKFADYKLTEEQRYITKRFVLSSDIVVFVARTPTCLRWRFRVSLWYCYYCL